MEINALVETYLKGAEQLRDGVAGLSPEEVRLRPIPGRWSTLEVVCHLSDFEIVFADRIKRVIAENEPPLPSGDENLFAARLAYHDRDLESELSLVEAIRKQVSVILRTLKPEDYQRRGIHSEAGPLTLETLVQRAAGHITHHLKFIAEKKRALGK
ncbi:MAG: DinB family protein [Thermoguttaceae bacterium]